MLEFVDKYLITDYYQSVVAALHVVHLEILMHNLLLY